MKLTISATPQGTLLNNHKVEDRLAAMIIRRARLVKALSETSIIVNINYLDLPGVWRMPWMVLKRMY